MPILRRVSIRLPGTAALRTLGRAMKGLEVRMARALNKVMHRTGPVFADRYHAHLLTSPREAANAVRYVLENWIVHAERSGEPAPSGVDPYCSAVSHDSGPPLVADAHWWMLCVGAKAADRNYLFGLDNYVYLGGGQVQLTR